MAKSLKEVGKNIQKAIAASKARAINRSLSAGRTEYTKRLRADTSLNTATLKKRIGLLPAQQSRPLGWLFVGFKRGFNVEEFKPKDKFISVVPRIKRTRSGRPKARKYLGVTAKVGKNARAVIPGVFRTRTKAGKELFLARKLAYSSGTYSRTQTARYPTVRIKLNPLADAARAHESAVSNKMQDSLSKNLSHEIAYRMGRLK